MDLLHSARPIAYFKESRDSETNVFITLQSQKPVATAFRLRAVHITPPPLILKHLQLFHDIYYSIFRTKWSIEINNDWIVVL